MHADLLAADLRLAVRAARAAGEAVLPFRTPGIPVTYKSADQPVTEADLLADRILRDTLLGERPAYGWLSEETADSPERLGRERVWIVDPIDGTRAFVDGYPEFGVSVGLAVDGVAVVGVVFNPATGELFHAVRGGGAFRDDHPIRADPGTAADRVLLASRTEIDRRAFGTLPPGWRTEPLGSTTYKLARVADGRGAGYLSLGPKSEWDLCAAALIVEEAGGVVTDLAGAAIRFNRPDPFLHGTVAASAALHGQLLGHASTLRSGARGTTGGTT